jgi:hypothetical protein
MWRKILQSWREILGWLMIAVFLFLCIANISNIPKYDPQLAEIKRFSYLTVTLLVLGWLWLNKKKDYGK